MKKQLKQHLKKHPNRTLLACLVLSIASPFLLGMDGLAFIASIPGVGLVYACSPFIFLQMLLCTRFRSKIVRLLPLILVAPIHLFGVYSFVTTYDAYAIPGLLIIIFTTLPMLGTALGWLAWWLLRDRGIL